MPGRDQSGKELVGVRPEDVDISKEGREGGVPGFVSEILQLSLGHSTLVTIRVGEDKVHALLTRAAPPAVGDNVWLRFRRYHLFERDSGRRLASHESHA